MNKPLQFDSELVRPQHLSDLTLPPGVVDRFQTMVEKGDVMNMLFFGQPGLGKTSAARVIMNSFPGSYMEISGSAVTIRDRVENFATSVSFAGTQKICFIDEAEFVRKSEQAALTTIIEKYWRNCRFILAVNNTSKLMPSLRSRLLEICFDVAVGDRQAVQEKMINQYVARLTQLDINFDARRLAELVGLYYPDLRQIAERIQFELALGAKD